MAKATFNYRDILKDIKGRKFSPVYILMGEEAYYIDMISDALENSVLPEEERDFNQHIFYGADANIDDVVATARQYPMMSDHQLVMLKEAQSMDKAKSTLEKLEPYMRKPVDSTVFVVVFKGDTLGATSAMVKAAVASGAVVFNSQPLKEFAMKGPIKDYTESKGLSIDDRAVEMLIENVGNSLTRAFGEIDKIAVALEGKGRRINPDMIASSIGVSKEFTSFELTDAIRDRNYKKAMTIVEYYSRNSKKNPVVMVNAVIFNFFAKLAIANFLKDQSDASIADTLKIKNSYALRNFRVAMANYPGIKPILAISAIRDLDVKSKGIGSAQDAHELLKELIFRIFTL